MKKGKVQKLFEQYQREENFGYTNDEWAKLSPAQRFKVIYSSGKFNLKELLYSKNPLFKLISKSDEFSGNYVPIPLNNDEKSNK